MSIGFLNALVTPITVQALADLGHVVDVTKADPYTLPGQAQGDFGGVAAEADAAVAELLADDLIRVPVQVVNERQRSRQPSRRWACRRPTIPSPATSPWPGSSAGPRPATTPRWRRRSLSRR